ncbi:haloacid dehalogenase type II [Pseudorhodoplanes sp.]|uniref:haloacid dehalogenase type II n=1 Tax=Pseudorhodoplanes sp. TaxID=1934341 RepID=UPI003D0C1F6D
MIKAVLFDAYGTLFDVYSIKALANDIFPGHGTALATSWRDKQIEYTRLRTMCDRYADFWQITSDALEFCCEDLGLNLSKSAHERLMNQYAVLSAYPENAAALTRLKSHKLQLGILSNGTVEMLKSALTASGLESYFDHVISIETVRKFKTAPEAYSLGPTTLGLSPDQVLFVSSNGWDVSGATWFGYRTYWLNRSRRPLERLGVWPHAIGYDMGALADHAIEQRG